MSALIAAAAYKLALALASARSAASARHRQLGIARHRRIALSSQRRGALGRLALGSWRSMAASNSASAAARRRRVAHRLGGGSLGMSRRGGSKLGKWHRRSRHSAHRVSAAAWRGGIGSLVIAAARHLWRQRISGIGGSSSSASRSALNQWRLMASLSAWRHLSSNARRNGSWRGGIGGARRSAANKWRSSSRSSAAARRRLGMAAAARRRLSMSRLDIGVA